MLTYLLLVALSFADPSATQTIQFSIVPAIPEEHFHTEPGGLEPGYWLHTLMDDGSGKYQWWCDWMELKDKSQEEDKEETPPIENLNVSIVEPDVLALLDWDPSRH